MPRPKKIRKVKQPPGFKGYRPYGNFKQPREPVILNLEEYESIRLMDYENRSQVDAAVLMGVSRPTLTRIYDSARKKMATAMAETRAIVIKGGQVTFDRSWFRCGQCHSLFHQAGQRPLTHCPVCDSPKIGSYEEVL